MSSEPSAVRRELNLAWQAHQRSQEPESAQLKSFHELLNEWQRNYRKRRDDQLQRLSQSMLQAQLQLVSFNQSMLTFSDGTRQSLGQGMLYVIPDETTRWRHVHLTSRHFSNWDQISARAFRKPALVTPAFHPGPVVLPARNSSSRSALGVPVELPAVAKERLELRRPSTQREVEIRSFSPAPFAISKPSSTPPSKQDTRPFWMRLLRKRRD